MYIWLPPVVDVGLSLQRPETIQMGYSLGSKSQDLTKNKPDTSNTTHHTSHSTNEFEVLKEIRDNDGGTLWQFIKKTFPQKVY